MNEISRQALADLFVETGQAHHHAYSEADGVDPEWASWYAPLLQARIGDGLGRKVSRSEIIYLLIKAQHGHEAADDGSPWPDYYAGVFLQG